MTEFDFFGASLHLATLTNLDVPALELLYRLEMSGDVFYDKLASKMTNPEVAELLRRNGREEVGHARRVRKAIDLKDPTYVAAPELDQLFDIDLPENVDAALFEVIVQAEISGDAGYQTWADNETDPEIKTLLQRNGREETLHGQRVTEAIALLRAEAS